jgi:hypothetical protein
LSQELERSQDDDDFIEELEELLKIKKMRNSTNASILIFIQLRTLPCFFPSRKKLLYYNDKSSKLPVTLLM